MKKINISYINLSLIILFTTILLRKFIQLSDFIYGLGIGISIALSAVSLYEFKKKQIKTNK